MITVTQLQQEMALAEKRRTGKERIGRDLRDDPPEVTVATDVQAEGEGHRAAMEAEAARKAYRDRGIQLGPDHGLQPGHPEPEHFDRPYIADQHAARSPQAEPPREMPITHALPGFVQQVTLPGTPAFGQVPQHIASSYSLGSPSDQ
jgi:hypothetical protein